MHSSSIITAFTSLLALASAAPSLKARLPAIPVVDVTVQTSPLNFAGQAVSSAIQVELGVVKVCIGNNGLPPCQASKLSISPFGNSTDINRVQCQGFSDGKAKYPVGNAFTNVAPAFLSQTATVAVGSVVCNYKY